MTIIDQIQQKADKIARRFNDDVESISVLTPDEPNNENYGSIIVEINEWRNRDSFFAREELQKFVLTLGAKLEHEYDADGDGVRKIGYCVVPDIDRKIRLICGDLMLLVNDSYGESTIYHNDDVPTNRDFWLKCGVAESEIENPDDHVPVRPLADEIIQNVTNDFDLLKFQSSANWGDFPGILDKLLSAFRECA